MGSFMAGKPVEIVVEHSVAYTCCCCPYLQLIESWLPGTQKKEQMFFLLGCLIPLLLAEFE
jgi:hypothetical protein